MSITKYIIIFLIAILNFNNLSFGAISVRPNFLRLSDKKRSTSATLSNASNEPVTVEAVPTYFITKPDLSKEAKKDAVTAKDRSATDLIHLSPRYITLNPKESQVIRILTYFPKNTPEGDFSAYLLFKEKSKTGKDSVGFDDTKKSSDKITTSVEMLINLGIPITITNGTPITDIKFTNAKIVFNSKKTMLSFDWVNNGTSLPRGRLIATLIKPNKETYEVMEGRTTNCPAGITPVSISINIKDSSDLKNGVVSLKFVSQPDEFIATEMENYKTVTLAETVINLK